MGTEEPPKIQRSSERKRATRIRGKIKAGTATPEDVEYLRNYDANKKPVGRPTTIVPPDDEPEQADSPDESLPPLPPPPPPPRIRTGVSEQSDDEGKRKNARATDDARHKAVLLIASQWRSALDFFNQQIVMSGGTPLLDTKHIWPFIVETTDDFLPDKVTLKPALVASVGTTVILAQRAFRHRKIAEAYERGVPPPAPPAPPEPPPPAVATPAPQESSPVPVAESEVPEPVPPIIQLAHTAEVEVTPPGGVW